MELRQYLSLVRKWAWLMLLIMLVAAGSSYFYSSLLQPIYRAETMLFVGGNLRPPNPNYNYYNNQVESASNLAQAYALLATQPPILQATADTLRWQDSWQTLYFRVSASAVGTQQLRISATDGDPRIASEIANEVARQIVLQNPMSGKTKQAEDDRAFVASQLGQLRLQIETSQKTLSNMSNQATLESDPKKLEDLNARISALQAKIDNWQRNYASLSALQDTGSDLLLTVLSPAQEPTAPASPNIVQNVLFAAIAGLVIGIGTVLLLEYLDDTIKNGDDVQRALGLATLGAITRIPHVRDPRDNLITIKHPRSPIAEAYRLLRTNLRFTGLENPSGALLVTSANPGEGKTTTAANLAVIFAQSGRRVILVDADLRRPSLHKFFGVANSQGLSSLFVERGLGLAAAMQPTAVEGLRLIPSGPVPPNPAEILDSSWMSEVLSELRAQADLVILDSPPVLAVADASIVGSRCSGAVLVVLAGQARSEVCRRALKTLTQTGVKVYGAVLNKQHTRGSAGYYSYYYSTKESRA